MLLYVSYKILSFDLLFFNRSRHNNAVAIKSITPAQIPTIIQEEADPSDVLSPNSIRMQLNIKH